MSQTKKISLKNIQECQAELTGLVTSGEFTSSVHREVIYTVLRDIVLRLGGTVDEFEASISGRYQVFEDEILAELERSGFQRMAAELDRRSLSDIPSTAAYPPLFPD